MPATQPSWKQRLQRLAAKFSYSDVIASAHPEGWDEFYSRFEGSFRGAPELIAQRMQARYYQRLESFFEEVRDSEAPSILLDLGCGRGEFLDLARSVGFVTQGVDSSEQMCLAAHSRGHHTDNGDLLHFLRQQASDSVAAVTAFHVIEHVSAHYCWQLIREAHRVLKPSGLLLLETPALNSLWVASRQFYLDPTHVRPVHMDYLAFAVRDAGFKTTELLAFDEVEGPDRIKLADKKLEDWLFGPQDAACWARK